jgi:ABC-type uncharacterized transport system involved in gliding motility auxiliary subunit
VTAPPSLDPAPAAERPRGPRALPGLGRLRRPGGDAAPPDAPPPPPNRTSAASRRLLPRPDSRRLSLLALLLAAAAFVCLNLFAGLKLTGLRIDMTSDGLYSVSDGTRELMRGIEEPVHLRLYASERLLAADPSLGAYAGRVRQMLRTYLDLGGGRIRLEAVDPEPFSPEEDRAIAFGLRPVAGPGGVRGFLGLAGTSSTDDVEAIPHLSPEREPFLEHDLTRLVHALARPERPVAALLDGLGLVGDPRSGAPPQAVLEPLRQLFQLRLLPPDAQRVPEGVRVLVLVHPHGLPPATLYAIDQFAVRGGRILAFVDPHAEAAARDGAPAPSDLDRLLAAWGLEMAPGRVVADRAFAQTVQASRAGRTVSTPYPPWIAPRGDALAQDHVVTAGLRTLSFASAGSLRERAGATARILPLVRSSADAMLLPAEAAAGSPDPLAILRGFRPDGIRHVIAARVSGPVASAFPDGPPQGAPENPAHRRAGEAPLEAIVVADADMLADGAWLEAGRDGAPLPIAGNADFVVRAVDSLAGETAILRLPVRGIGTRPFTTIDEMRREAELRLRDRERDLVGRLEEAEARIGRVAAENRTEGVDVILTTEQQRAIERARTDAVAARAELREVQRALRADIDALEARVRFANIVLVPGLVAALLVGWGLWRRFRPARRRPAPAGA